VRKKNQRLLKQSANTKAFVAGRISVRVQKLMANQLVGDPKELTSEVHKALDQCSEETVTEAIAQLDPVPLLEDASKEEKINAVEKAILNRFGPQRFTRALGSSEKHLNQLKDIFSACKLPENSELEDLRYVRFRYYALTCTGRTWLK
jgi:hypothetical protein